MKPLDLSGSPPRSCYCELDGLMLLLRTIDKLRAQLPGGNSGGYFINGTQMRGISGYLMHRLGLEEGELRQAVANAADENAVAAWLRERTDGAAYPAINETLRRIKPSHTENEALFRAEYAETLREQPELEYVVDIVDADDRRRFG